MKDALILLLAWFMIVFFAVFLSVLAFRLAMASVNNIMGVIL